MDFVKAHYIGLLIILLSVGCVMAVLIVRWKVWVSCKPKHWYGEIGIIWQEGADKKWDGLEETIDAILDIVPEIPNITESHEDVLSRFWIEVVPYNGLVTSKNCPSGYIEETTSGRNIPVPKPATYTGAVARRIGTTEGMSFLPFTRRHFVIRVMQTRSGDTAEKQFWAIGIGSIRPAGESAIIHEFAEHLVPFVMTEHWNPLHLRHDLIGLSTIIQDNYQQRMKQKANQPS